MTVAAALRAFGRFWWDFLIGDTPELAGGTLVVIVIAWAIAHGPGALVVCFPAAVVVLLAASLWRGRRG
ncbi:MAG TPA: hypothetical protein VMW47_08535 [Verrucomicrobiae bacterium]|nr:hypothetical protein [Verrucomicrobiae bacterium]